MATASTIWLSEVGRTCASGPTAGTIWLSLHHNRAAHQSRMKRAEISEAPRLREPVAELLTVVERARRKEARALDGVRCLTLVRPGHGRSRFYVDHLGCEAEVA